MPTIPRRVRAILAKYNATMLLPGVGGALRFGYQPGNYSESTSQTLAAADQQVGLVVDAARAPGPELATNGGFDTNLSDWTIGASVSAVQNSGEAVVTFAGSFLATGSNWFSTGPIVNTGDARTFAISFDATWVSGAGSLQIGTGYALAGTIAPNSSKTRYSVISRLGGGVGHPTNRGAAVFGATASGTTWRIDNVSVRELPGIHASQSTSGFKPVVRNEGGIQSWQFDGTDDRLSLSAVPFQMSDDHFVIIGFTPLSLAANQFLYCQRATSSNQPVAGLRLTTTSRLEAFYRNDAGVSAIPANSGAASVGSARVYSSVASAGNVIAAVDLTDSAPVSLPVGAATFNTATLGASVSTLVADFANGHMHGMLIGKGAISASERQTLVKFMAQLQGRSL